MDFIQQLELWNKGEVLQSKIMIGVGLLLLVGWVSIVRSQNELLRGMLIPLGLLVAVLIGYGSFILYQRPLHTKESIAYYQQDKEQAIIKEIEKHTNDNKTGKMLLRIYPILALLGSLAFMLVASPYYKGMAMGFILISIVAFVMDSGFVSRSEVVIQNLSK